MGDECFLCVSNETDPIVYGELKESGGIKVHYYCLLLGPNLVNDGNDEEGIMGFKLKDIISEKRRIRTQVCCYCKKKHANLSCSVKRCKKSFHINCGVQRECLLQFSHSFPSYCKDHALKQIDDESKHEDDEECAICFSHMGPFNKIKSIRAPCCHTKWFHQYCLQKYANYGGYFFKCPLCNDVNTITEVVKMRGVFVPEKDAEWELEPQAFSELLERPTKCEALSCICPKGRDHFDENMYYCRSCGSSACHECCLEGQVNFLCEFCNKLVAHDAECLQSNPESEDQHEEQSLFILDSEIIKVQKYKILTFSIIVKDCMLKENHLNEEPKESDMFHLGDESLMSSCASYVDRLSPVPTTSHNGQCNTISISKYFENRQFDILKLKSHDTDDKKVEATSEIPIFDISGSSGTSRDENSNNKWDVEKPSLKRKQKDDYFEHSDAKKTKFDNSTYQNQVFPKDFPVMRKTLGIRKNKPKARAIHTSPGQKRITSYFTILHKKTD